MRKLLLFTAFLAMLGMAGGASAGADSNYQSIPGNSCHPFANNLADLLQRNHIRLQNPSTSGREMYVVCPLVRDAGKIQTTASHPFGYIHMYRQSGAANFDDTSTECYIYQYDNDNAAVPGGSQTGRYFSTLVNIASIQGNTTSTTFFQMPAEHSDNFGDYYSMLCLLKPGMGINSVDLYQY